MPTRIFLVEDHPVMRDAYAAVLRADLDPCGMAASAEEAMAALDGPDGLVCDLVVKAAGEVVGVTLLDSVVCGYDGRYTSLTERGRM